MLFLYKLVFVFILSSVPDDIGMFSSAPEARCVPEAPAVTAPCSTHVYMWCVCCSTVAHSSGLKEVNGSMQPHAARVCGDSHLG